MYRPLTNGQRVSIFGASDCAGDVMPIVCILLFGLCLLRELVGFDYGLALPPSELIEQRAYYKTIVTYRVITNTYVVRLFLLIGIENLRVQSHKNIKNHFFSSYSNSRRNFRKNSKFHFFAFL